MLQKEHILAACSHLLKPVVRFLLRHGVTWSEFSELGKDVYVLVARSEHGIQGRPTNNSRVAMMTGLSRREVASVRNRILQEQDRPEHRQGNRISKILTGWHVDPEFRDGDGKPIELPANGPTASLSSLFKRYAGDLPHSALQKELLQRGLIEQLKNGKFEVLKRDYTYSALDPEIVRQMSVALHDHATTLNHNLDEERKSPARFEGLADSGNISIGAARNFAKLVESRGFDFLREMDDWLSAHEVDESDSDKARQMRAGVGIYLIYDEI